MHTIAAWVSMHSDTRCQCADPRCACRSRPPYWLPSDGRLLIHCANGHGRAGLVAAAWLIGQGLAGSPKEALDLLQSVRPRVRLRRCQRESLAVASCLLASSIEQEHASERWIGGGDVQNRSVAGG